MPGPLFFFFAAVALVTLAAAARFAFRPAERSLALVRPLCAATITSSLAAFFAGATNGLVAFSRMLQGGTSVPGWQVAGAFAESLVALILGFALVSVAWLLVAVGLRRQP
jgi:hypothetical protein